MPATVIVNARLVNEGRVTEGDLRIENGRIARIAAEIRPQGDDTVIDAAGRWLLPGMIDDQVHFREPGMPHKGDMATESAAAVAGGLTTFMDMPNTSPPTLDAAALEDKYQRAKGRAWGNYGFYLGASNDTLEAIRTLDPKTAPGIKVFRARPPAICWSTTPTRWTRSSARHPRRSSPIAKTRRPSTPTWRHSRPSTAMR